MKAKDKEITRVMITGTIYNLFIYLMYSTKEEIDSTYFFFTDGIPRSIGNQLNCFYFTKRGIRGRLRFIERIYTHLTRHWRWPFLRTANIFGQDHLFFSSPLIGSRGMTIIEDGTASYLDTRRKSKHKSKLKSMLYGSRITEPRSGESLRDDKVILTGIGITPDAIKDKTEIIDINALWSIKNPEYREWLLSIFNLKRSHLNDLQQRSTLLLVQNLESYGVPEDVIVDVYRKMVDNIPSQDLVIKPHPSSSIDYEHYFPEAYVFKEKIPMEIITLMGVKFKDVYTVSTTAALSMPKSVNVHFLGTSVHPLIEKAIGRMEYYDFVKHK